MTIGDAVGLENRGFLEKDVVDDEVLLLMLLLLLLLLPLLYVLLSRRNVRVGESTEENSREFSSNSGGGHLTGVVRFDMVGVGASWTEANDETGVVLIFSG
jgi:hypothetical protein